MDKDVLSREKVHPFLFLLEKERYLLLEKEGHKTVGIFFLLLDFLFHPVGCHLEKEVDEVLVCCLCSNHAKSGDVFISTIRWNDEQWMP